MNIFAVSKYPDIAAKELPDKHIVKMPLECAQMLAIVYSPWYFNWGALPKKDGEPYNTEKGAHRNHPCTKWVAEHYSHTAWTIEHMFYLLDEYQARFHKVHGCWQTFKAAERMFHRFVGTYPSRYSAPTTFVRAMPDELKNDKSIDDHEAYRRYLLSKPWVYNNYNHSSRPDWMIQNVA